MTPREAFEATIGTQLERIGAALDAIADALVASSANETGIDSQARAAARDRVNLRSLRRNHPDAEEL